MEGPYKIALTVVLSTARKKQLQQHYKCCPQSTTCIKTKYSMRGAVQCVVSYREKKGHATEICAPLRIFISHGQQQVQGG